MHFFFPKDYAHAVGDSLTGFLSHISLWRYFYSDRGKDYMFVGVPWDWIDAAPVGDLIIDPSVSPVASEDVWLEDSVTGLGGNTQVIIGKARDPWTDYAKKRTLIPGLPKALAGQANSTPAVFPRAPSCSMRK